jgi:putative transposase
MIVVRHPTAEELVELKRMTRREIGWVAQRAQMILLSAQERIVPEMAQIFDVHPKTVRHWIGRFNQAGPAGLYDAPRSGRPRRATTGVRDALVDMIQQDPAGSGYLATFWTVAMLVLALANRLTVRISASTVRATLRAVGLRWGRPRLAMPNKTDPHKAAKQWAIAQAVIDAGPTATVLYADEARIALLPLLRAMWHWVGQQVRIPTPGSNVSRAVFGALNIRTGEWTYLVREHMDKENFIAFLEHLLLVYATGTIILIVDNYSSHTAGAVATWLAAQTRLKLFYLPKYCSHLNPVENIWLHLKGRMAANRLYGSMKLLLDFVDSFFTAMTPELALTWADA